MRNSRFPCMIHGCISCAESCSLEKSTIMITVNKLLFGDTHVCNIVSRHAVCVGKNPHFSSLRPSRNTLRLNGSSGTQQIIRGFSRCKPNLRVAEGQRLTLARGSRQRKNSEHTTPLGRKPSSTNHEARATVNNRIAPPPKK